MISTKFLALEGIRTCAGISHQNHLLLECVKYDGTQDRKGALQ